MDGVTGEWLNLILRWFHVVAGIAWIGQTYLFNWMERHLAPPETADAKGNVAGRLWMVHGGGFYLVEKQRVPELMPRTLHWFRFESALTWLSGLVLLIVVYHLGGLMVEEGVSEISSGAASAIGLGAVVAIWPVYDALCRSPLRRSETATAVAGFVLILAVGYGLTRVLSGRAAFMHVGAMFGTVMVANVWSNILPAQRRLIAALKEGRAPDMGLATQARMRSKHNTYLSVPLIFLMVSNHFPTASYGHAYNWAMLGVFVLVGWAGAKVLRDLL
jgi:uncharacterized membrane protein